MELFFKKQNIMGHSVAYYLGSLCVWHKEDDLYNFHARKELFLFKAKKKLKWRQIGGLPVALSKSAVESELELRSISKVPRFPSLKLQLILTQEMESLAWWLENLASTGCASKCWVAFDRSLSSLDFIISVTLSGLKFYHLPAVTSSGDVWNEPAILRILPHLCFQVLGGPWLRRDLSEPQLTVS